MNKTLLIFKHEFMHTVKRAGFIIMTAIVPLLALAGIGMGALIAPASGPEATEVTFVGYVDESGVFTRDTAQGSVTFVRFGSVEQATDALLGGRVPEYFVIPSDYLTTGRVYRYTLTKDLGTPFETIVAVKNFLTGNLLEGRVSPGIAALVKAPLDVRVTRLSKTGETSGEQSGIGNIIIPSAFALLLALSLLFSSNYFLQGMGEERESRLIEVLLSSVSVRQLLTGKILGLGAAGLLQVAVWLFSAPLLLSLSSSSPGGLLSSLQIPAHFLILGILYFVLGYFLFAVLSICIGAVSPNAREGQQLGLIYTLFGFVPLWLLSLLMFFPNSPIWVVLTIFPVTAPVQTMLRLGVTDIPLWQIVVSLAVMALSVIGVLALAIRVFRTHLLVYGKRPKIGEIIRNLKNR